MSAPPSKFPTIGAKIKPRLSNIELITEKVLVECATGGDFHGTEDSERLFEVCSSLLADRQVILEAEVGDPAKTFPFFLVIHKSIAEIDFSSAKSVLACLLDQRTYLIWACESKLSSAGGCRATLSLGDKDAGWGATFTLPKADRHLPFYFDEAALHRIYPLISNGDPVPTAPVPTPTPTPNPVDVLNATLVARLAVQEAQMVTQAAEMAKLQSMVAAMVAGTAGGGGSGLNLGATGHLRNLASPGVVPTVTPSGVVPTDHTLAFIQMMSQMNSTMALALAGKAQAAPVIIVPPAQSETRRQDLNSIQAFKPSSQYWTRLPLWRLGNLWTSRPVGSQLRITWITPARRCVRL